MMMTTTRKNDFQGRAKQANFLIQVCIKNDRFRARVGGRRLRQGWPEKKSFLASRQKEPRQPPPPATASNSSTATPNPAPMLMAVRISAARFPSTKAESSNNEGRSWGTLCTIFEECARPSSGKKTGFLKQELTVLARSHAACGT